MGKILTVEGAAADVADKKPKGRHLFAAWTKARAVRVAREQLLEERVRNAKLGASFNDCLAQAKQMRAEKLALDVTKVGGWRQWGAAAAALEMAAQALDAKAADVHNYFVASLIRIADLVKVAGESNAAHDNLKRRLEADARQAADALAKLVAKEAAGADQQRELEQLDAPPV